VVSIPQVVTRRYNPALGVWFNLCALPDIEAERVLERLRLESRPTLKPDYLTRRRATEHWLSDQAGRLLGAIPLRPPVYFFLGDFSWSIDHSRPAALVLPLASLPAQATTFTLGDSMKVMDEPSRRVYSMAEIIDVFSRPQALAGFGLSDRSGVQSRFVEVQVWDCASIALPS
jgi:hypothetical protein